MAAIDKSDPVAGIHHDVIHYDCQDAGCRAANGRRPVAALPPDDPFVQRIREYAAQAGYVLVNAEGLAAALHDGKVGCEWNPVGYATHDGDHEKDAAAILAAIQEQTDE